MISVPILYYVYQIMGNDFDATPLPTLYACLIALSIGIFVPALSAIIPITKALSKNLNESINHQRSKNTALSMVRIFFAEIECILGQYHTDKMTVVVCSII